MTLQELIFDLERLRDKYGNSASVRVLAEGQEPESVDIIDIYEQHNEITLIINL